VPPIYVPGHGSPLEAAVLFLKEEAYLIYQNGDRSFTEKISAEILGSAKTYR